MNIVVVYTNNEKKILYVIFFLLLSIIALFYIYSLFDGKYFVEFEDEFIYYNSAKLFYETSSVKAALILNEDVSPVLQTSWYGPAYHLFYGGIAKIIGFGNLYFIGIHFLIFLITLLIIFKYDLDIKLKLLICIAILLTENIVKNIFTYYPETLQILFSVVAFFFLFKLSKEPDKRKYFFYYIGIVLFFSMMRVTSIFWIFGIIPFYNSKRQMIQNLMIVVTGFSGIILYMRFFCAPASFSGLKNLDLLFNFEILEFIKSILKNVFTNIELFFQQEQLSVSTYILLILIVITFVNFLQTKKKILLSSLFITLTLLVFFIFFYVTAKFFFEKQTAFLFPLLIIANIKEYKNFILLISLCSLPYSMTGVYKTINLRKQSFQTIKENMELISEFKTVREKIDQNNQNIILWIPGQHDYPCKTIAANVPLSTKKGYPILWTNNRYPKGSVDSITFKIHNKLDVNYIISKYKPEINNIQLIDSTKYFFIYKIIK